MKIRPRSAQGLPPDRAGRPACREGGMASPGLCLRRPGALRPPVPQTGKVPVPRTVSSFLLRKKLKTLDSSVTIKAVRNVGYTLEVPDA